MAAPYSSDLREKAVSAIDRGQKKSHVCKTFNISRNTLDNWLKLREKTGSIAPKIDYRRGPKPKINDLKAFEEFVKQNQHLTQEEMAQKWETPVSKTAIAKALKKIGFTR